MVSHAALHHAGKLPAAREKLLEAWSIKKTFDIAANLGFVESELKEWAAAAEHLDYAYRTFPLSGTPKEKENIEKFRQDAMSKTGRFKVTTEAGAELLVDDVSRGPVSDQLYFVLPGMHSVVVRKPGKLDEKRDVQLAAGQEAGLNIALKDGAGTVEPGGEGRPIWPAILLGSLAGVGLGVGIAGVVVGTGKASEAEDASGALPDGACAANASACEEADDLFSQGNTFVGMGIAGFTIAGAAGLGTIIYLVVPSGDDKTKEALRVRPMLGSANGLFLEGQF